MHDLIFDNQENLTPPLMAELTTKLGLDSAKMEACLKDPSTEAMLQQDISWGDQIQLQSTPTMVINGRRLSGARSPQDLENLLRFLEREIK